MQNFDFNKIKGKRVMLEIQTFLQQIFTNSWSSEWLLVNEKMILMVGLDENQ